MIDEGKLSTVLSEFARTVITDFPIQGILDHLVVRIVEVVPVDSAGVTLISAGNAPHYIAASDADALRFEKLQTELGEGPCLAAFETGASVSVADLANDCRFPQFAVAAVQAGLAATFTFPLRHNKVRLGALDLYRNTPGQLDAHDLRAAQTLADVAAAYLLNAKSRDDANAASDRLFHLSMHDPLTGLPNRLLFEERIEHAAQRAQRSRTTAAILFADLDDFKHVNDVYGHHVGDQLLRSVATRLNGLIRPGDTLARFSGDEFVILCEDLSSAADVDGLARRIHDKMAKPFTFNDTQVRVTASIGIAFAGPGEDISNEMVADADRAMYTVKGSGGAGHAIVDIRSRTHAPGPQRLEVDLGEALANEGLETAYQPIVRTADGLVAGIEALLRWTHPERGVVPPLTIIALAERTGLINELGSWVLERSCQDHVRWLHDNPAAQLDLAVNVSALQLAKEGFAQTVVDIVSRTNLRPEHLILEMTETSEIDNSDRVMTVLSDLRAAGIRLAIDDFGTGFSSLSYLGRLPIDIVKIDRCFIADMLVGSGRRIVGAIIDLAHDLGLEVIAEGVETRGQRDILAALGCDAAQGYFYARPAPVSAIRSIRGARLVRRPCVEQRRQVDERGVAGVTG